MAKKTQKKTAEGVSSFVINRRLLFLFASVLVLFTILVLRLGQIQIIKANEYASQAMELQTREFSVSSDRGLIYDANGKTVAVNQAGYTLWATPQDIAEQEKEHSGYTKKLAKELAGILTEADLSEDDIYEKLTSESKTVKLVKYVDEVTYRDIEKLMEEDFPVGIVSAETTRRYYPMGEFASHIIGLTNDDNTGTFGIELYYDQYLNGSEGKLITSTDASGRKLVTGVEKYYPAEEGLSVVLTIDEMIQHYTESAVKSSYYSMNPQKAMAIVMDPKTGYILGMASYPDFNLNDPKTPVTQRDIDKLEKMTDQEKVEYWSGTMWRNPMISDTYEPGSPFKLATTAMAIEEGITSIGDTFVCRGTMNVDGTILSCWRSYAPHGGETLLQGVANSCNPVFMTLALRAGFDRFYKYLGLFGFGSRTGIDFPAEAAGIVRNQADAGKVELATMSYGQGISTTMVQMISALGSLGNDGKLMRPRLVSKLINSDGETVVEYEPEVIRQVVSKNTAHEMCLAMEGVVSNGTGTSAYVKGYHVGGKTGTSNKPGKGGYTDNVWSSFFAMAPMDDPVVAVLVVVDAPQAQHSGGKVAGPVVHDIMSNVLKYLNVATDYNSRNISPSGYRVTVPDVVGMSFNDAAYALQQDNLEPICCSGGSQDFIVAYQYPPAGSTLEKNDNVCLYSE